jgi:hypothetical protein
MGKIIDGVLYERNRLEGWYRVTTTRCGPVRERVVSPAYQWEEVGPAPEFMLMPNREPDPVKDAEWLAEEKEKNQRRAARRAKLACKWAIVHEGFDELLTLTYRENQQDETLFKRHFKEWVRRMKRALPDFRYCAGFEPQERGAWHAHVATHKLPKHALYKGVKIAAWRLGTEIWRAVVGADNGMCFVGGKPARWGGKRRNMSLYKMANYVAKYITKHYELMPDGKNRYSRSNGAPLVERERLHFQARDIGELISLVFELNQGEVVMSHRLDRGSEFYLLATEAMPPSFVLQ